MQSVHHQMAGGCDACWSASKDYRRKNIFLDVRKSPFVNHIHRTDCNQVCINILSAKESIKVNQSEDPKYNEIILGWKLNIDEEISFEHDIVFEPSDFFKKDINDGPNYKILNNPIRLRVHSNYQKSKFSNQLNKPT